MAEDKNARYKIEAVTKDKLLHYLGWYKNIEIIPLKGNEPIVILKSLVKPDEILGRPDRIVIHKGNFILPVRIVRKAGGSKNISYISPEDVNYPNKFKKTHPSKEFLIQSILDNQIKISDKRYIRPIRDFFRKYKIIKEKRGKTKKKYERLIKERKQFILQVYKEICRKTGRKKPLPIGGIQKRLGDYAATRKYSDNPEEAKKEAKIFDVSDATIRRIMKSCIKK